MSKLMEYVEIERIFDDYLLCDVDVMQDDILIKSGKLKMVTVKNHIIKLYLDCNGVIKTFDYFYPFATQYDDQKIVLDYRFKELYKNNKIVEFFIRAYTITEPLKFTDAQIIIKKK